MSSPNDSSCNGRAVVGGSRTGLAHCLTEQQKEGKVRAGKVRFKTASLQSTKKEESSSTKPKSVENEPVAAAVISIDDDSTDEAPSRNQTQDDVDALQALSPTTIDLQQGTAQRRNNPPEVGDSAGDHLLDVDEPRILPYLEDAPRNGILPYLEDGGYTSELQGATGRTNAAEGESAAPGVLGSSSFSAAEEEPLPGAIAIQQSGNGSSTFLHRSFTTSHSFDIDDDSDDDDDDLEGQTPQRGLSTGSLTVASAIMETNLPQAQQMSANPGDNKCTSSWKAALGGLLLVGLVVTMITFLVVFLMGTIPGSEEDGMIVGDMAVQDSVLQSDEELLLSLLPDYSIDATRKIGSPQALALEWMINDPNFRSYASWRIVQRFALATIFLALGGKTEAGWGRSDHWMSYDYHECSWFHVEIEENLNVFDPSLFKSGSRFNFSSTLGRLQLSLCDEDNTEYQGLSLPRNGLKGTLPPEVYLLTSLEAISLRSNKLHGSISTLIGKLSNLMVLDGIGNQFTSSIPTEIGLLQNFTALFLLQNEMSGRIPTEIGRLSSMLYLGLDSNKLSGRIPSELGLIELPRWLLLQNNRLSGTLPTELARLKSREIHVFNNSLTGTLPTEYGQLHATRGLSLGDNLLSGTLPTQLGTMRRTRLFAIWNTRMTGKIPSQWGLATNNLQGILLSNNSLTGTIPSQLGLTTNLWGFVASGNRLHGTIPTELASLPLQLLQLNRNDLHGPIPSEIGTNQTPLELLDLSDNQLTGSIPTEIGLTSKLLEVRLNNNHLSGSIPSSVGGLFTGASYLIAFMQSPPIPEQIVQTATPQWSLLLGNNSFSGAVPSEFGLLTNLKQLSLSKNHFVGSLPTSYGLMERLVRLDLGDNILAGPVRSELGQLPRLESLDISGNTFTGMIPTELGYLPLLKSLDVSNNSLFGTIPKELSSMDQLDISGNNFTGTIPVEFCLQNASVFHFDCNHRLCGCSCICPT